MKQGLAGGLAVFASFIFVARPAIAAPPLAQEDVDYFLEESYSCRDTTPVLDWEYLLCEAVKEGKSITGARSSFASKIGHPEGDAAIVMAAIIEIARFDRECGYREDGNYDCRFEPGAIAYDKFAEAQQADESGELAFVIGKTVGSDGDPIEWRRAFLQNVVQHPGRSLTFRRMLDYTRDDLWIFAVAAAGHLDFETARLIFLRQCSTSMSERASWDGSSVALLELLLRRDVDDDVRRLLSYALISLQMKAGMNDSAVSTYLRLPARLRAYWPRPTDEVERYDCDRQFDNYVDFNVNLAGALIEQERSSLARRLMGEASVRTVNFTKVGYSIRARARVVQEILKPRLSIDEVFDYFVHGRLPTEPKIDEENTLDGPGWVFHMENSPAVRTIAAKYLTERGYAQMADYLIGRALYYRSDRSDSLIDLLLPLLSSNFAERQRYWRAKIDAAWSASDSKRRNAPKAPAPTEKLPTAAEKVFDERLLPPPFRIEESDPNFSERFSPQPPDGIVLPVEDFQLARYSEERGERQIIYLSSALDAPGEIPAYGYWFQQTRGGMKEWDEPIYLGFQQYFPYVVVSRSKLPLFEVGGLLIEVEAKEINRKSITFPPVGLSFKRDERNLYLAFQLDELKRDTDADGLADLVEQRLQMNWRAADTDGDGLQDTRDPLPLTAFDAGAPIAEKELAYAILSVIVGYERQAIVESPRSPGVEFDLADAINAERPPSISDGAVFLEADPKLFAGVRTPFRLFVFSQDEVSRINADGAPFFPVGVSAIFSRPDNSEHYVIWSAGWVGGEFIVRCKADKCETEETSRWIT